MDLKSSVTAEMHCRLPHMKLNYDNVKSIYNCKRDLTILKIVAGIADCRLKVAESSSVHNTKIQVNLLLKSNTIYYDFIL